jgi:CubicO group peptidase (beta-lactamase class C family)
MRINVNTPDPKSKGLLMFLYVASFVISASILGSVAWGSPLLLENSDNVEPSKILQSLGDWLAAVNNPDDKVLTDYMTSNYAPAFLDGAPISVQLRLHRRMGQARDGLSLEQVIEENANRLRAILVGGNGDRIVLTLELDANNLISMLGVNFAQERVAAPAESSLPGDHAQTEFQYPSTPAGNLAQDWYSAYLQGTDSVVEFFNQNAKPALISLHGEGWIKGAHEMMRNIGGQQSPIRILKSTPNEITVLHDDGHGGLEVTIYADDEHPDLIGAFGMKPRSMPAPIQADRANDSAQFVEELDDLVNTLAQEDRFSGTVLVAKKNQVLLSNSWGDSSKDFGVRNEIDTRFNLGSMNKMFTAISIMRLVEDGKINLNDTVAQLLPEYTNREAANRMTVRSLLSHTSGLGSDRLFGPAWRNAAKERFATTDDWLALFDSESLQSDPGTYEYSNSGYIVLGKIIEKISGESYDDFVQHIIFNQIGMNQTGAYPGDEVVEGRAVGYYPSTIDLNDLGDSRWKNNQFRNVYKGSPAGGGYSTAPDLLRFANALRAGKIVSRKTLRSMVRPQTNISDSTLGYGYGFGVNRNKDNLSWWGHSGGFRGVNAEMRVYPDADYTIIVLSNYDGAAEPLISAIDQMIPFVDN